MKLSYTVGATGEKLTYRNWLVATTPHFGRLRWWFLCPLVVNGRAREARVKKLYLPPGGRCFGCRRCHDLTYESAQTHGTRMEAYLRKPRPAFK